MNQTIEQLQTAFEELPEELQDYITSDGVQKTLTKLGAWFDITDMELFRQAVMTMLVGLAGADEFIQFAHEKLNFPIEDAENLFGEVGGRVLEQAQIIFEKTVQKTESVDQNKKSEQEGLKSTVDAPKASGDVRRFVGVPFYGVERPASSYTSILPRSDVDVNKLGDTKNPKDTPTLDSFIKKVGPNGTAGPIIADATEFKKRPDDMSKKAEIPPNLPVLEKDEPSTQLSSIQFSKLAAAMNIPRQESRVTPMPAPSAPPAPPAPTPKPTTMPPTVPTPGPITISSINAPSPGMPLESPTPTIQKPQIPVKSYSGGQDPYRESPTP